MRLLNAAVFIEYDLKIFIAFIVGLKRGYSRFCVDKPADLFQLLSKRHLSERKFRGEYLFKLFRLASRFISSQRIAVSVITNALQTETRIIP